MLTEGLSHELVVGLHEGWELAWGLDGEQGAAQLFLLWKAWESQE